MARRKRATVRLGDGSGVVRLRKDTGNYVIDYRHPRIPNRDHRKTETIGKDRKLAEEELTQRLIQLNKGKLHNKRKNKTFEKYADEWVKGKINIKESTLTGYKSYLKKHLIPYFWEMTLHEIEREDIHRFIKVMLDKGKSPKTISNVLITLRQVLLDAIVDGYIEKDPYIRIAKPKLVKKEIDILDITEVNLLLQTLEMKRDEFYLLFKLAIESGLRQGELFALYWEDFNWKTNQVFVRRSYYRGTVTTPKSQKSIRRVDLTPSLVSELKAYRHIKSDLVFCTAEGKPLDRRIVVGNHLEPALRKAGLRRIRFHDLRHTNVSIRIASGQEIKYISTQVGHASVQFTLDVYGHLMPTHRKQQASKLESYFTGNGMVTDGVKYLK